MIQDGSDAKAVGMAKKTSQRSVNQNLRGTRKLLEWVYVLGLRTLLPLRHSELYPLALFQGTEAR